MIHRGRIEGLANADDGAVVQAIATLLERIAALESSEPSSDVLETLARRGLDAPLRAHLHALVLTAQQAAAPTTTSDTSAHAAETMQRTEREMLALYHWLNDWSATARAFISRKDWLFGSDSPTGGVRCARDLSSPNFKFLG